MFKWFLLQTIVVCFGFFAVAQTPISFRRICENGPNNELYFTLSNDTCSAFFQYKIWGRNGFVGPFTLIDSILIKTQDNYIHINASPTGATNWFYYISIFDSCGPVFEIRSDTEFVDRMPPEIVFLDSVSINPLTNTPVAGWGGNNSADFSYYKLYEIKGINTPILPFNKDTLRTDISSIPVSDSLRYALSSVDSCGKETEFRFNRHVTIYLEHILDTCEKTVILTWTPYIGWNSIRQYYIYKQYEARPPILYDSLGSGFLSYTDTITLGLSYSYFIRAIKDSVNHVTSTSNSVLFASRFRKEPQNSYLSLVSVSKPDDLFLETSIYNPNEEVVKYDIYMAKSISDNFTFMGSVLNGSANTSKYLSLFPFQQDLKATKAFAYNGCNQSFAVSPVAVYTSLEVQAFVGSNRLLWNPYSTWNVGVKQYLIYRGTNNNAGIFEYSLLDSVSSVDLTYIDSVLPLNPGEEGVCYYIVGNQNSGDINGESLQSKSSTACVLSAFSVFIPNAFSPLGSNQLFRPEGSSIDYDQSKMEIYDRWGSRIYSQTNIRNGWNGKDENGTVYEQGVYFYKLIIKSLYGSEKVCSGFVTLLN